jgi:hypothetical protein
MIEIKNFDSKEEREDPSIASFIGWFFMSTGIIIASFLGYPIWFFIWIIITGVLYALFVLFIAPVALDLWFIGSFLLLALLLDIIVHRCRANDTN